MQRSVKKESKHVVTNELRPNESVQVVIVGAGLAGLAAAQRLHRSGIEDVVVLDAQNRIGGRVHTIDHSDYVLELGAQWLHGANENPLYNWLLEKDMLDDFEDASLGFSGLFCTSNGCELDETLVKKALSIMVEGKMALSKNYYHDLIGENGFTNAGDLLKYHLEKRLLADDELNGSTNKKLVYALFDWFLRYETIENCCDSMSEVSTTSYTDWSDLGDGTLLNFKYGYRSLLHWFCDHMPANKWIFLNKEVIGIEMLRKSDIRSNMGEQQYDRPMIVKYMDNIGGKCENKVCAIECDHVIVTASLGFLKNNLENQFFKPRLPKIKRELIKSIGFGTVNKIVLQFDSPFWHNDHGIKLIWHQDQMGLEKFPNWVRGIIAFDVVRRQPNLLIGWIGGLEARLMEQESDETIAKTCLEVLAEFLPSTYSRPTRLVSCICSRWNSNPFTCGSYSFQSMQSFDLNVSKLHEPIYNSTVDKADKLGSSSTSRVPRILFAGEATAGKLYSTAHGAVISGWREADRLTDYLMGANGKNIYKEQQ